MILIIRSNGDEEYVDATTHAQIREAIGAEILDSVNLRDGRTMLVDDLGYSKGRPTNAKATALYHAVCKPWTTHQIIGDVAIVPTE